MAELMWLPGAISLKGAQGELRARSLVRVMLPGGAAGEVPVGGLRDAHTVHGAGSGFAAQLHFTNRGRYDEADLTVTYTGPEPLACGLQVAWELAGEGAPTFMIPGIFYGLNRGYQGQQAPSYASAGGKAAELVSDAWSFRADRTAVPAVFAWNETGGGALAVDEVSGLGQAGVGFAGGRHGSELRLNFPYREVPAVYLEPGKAGPADCPVWRWEPGSVVHLTYRIYLCGPDRHAYDPFVRALYDRDVPECPLGPWLPPAEAAELAAYGLWRWHFRGGENLLVERVAFDRVGDDRCEVCVDLPAAYALLRHGKYAAAGRAVLDQAAASGASASASARATLFLIRALKLEPDHANWRAAIASALADVVRRQGADGALDDPLWISALVEAGEDPAYREAALKAGRHFAALVREEFMTRAPASELGHHAVIAYVSLYEADRQDEWLDLARRAADWAMTFRWTYNLEFPRHSLLRRYDFRSRGADLASPADQYLHGSGLLCLPELLRLAQYTGDRYYRERTRDNLACFLQFIAREDGDFNAYKGMVPGRWYNTNHVQPKGMLLMHSLAGPVGLLLYACLEAERMGFLA